MSQKFVNVLAAVVKYGLFILPAAALIVSGEFLPKPDLGTFFGALLLPGVGDLFFPFIGGKNFFFRILVELLFLFWVFAAAFDRRFRPGYSPIFWAVLATLLVLTLATIFGANPYRSFWSNYERMEGLVGHIHLFLYFLIAVSVLKTERDWRWFFHASIFVSLLVGLYAVWQLLGLLEIHQGGDRIDATLGNATYLAAYLFFHLFLALYFFVKTHLIGWKIFYALVFVFETFLLYHTATRGTILGFIGAILLFSLISAFSSRERRYRLYALGGAAAIILLVGGFYLIKDTKFVEQSYTLARFRGISFNETTTQSRFILWGLAMEGLKERPILGWGPENFNLIFSKYYDPRLWRQEPWFDRAHNVFFDWLISGGILGLASYLSIFGSALFMLWKGALRKGLTAEAGVFTAMLAGYFFQNIFVFDNFTSYLLFFSVLGFLHFKYSQLTPASLKPGFESPKKPGFSPAGGGAPLRYILPVLTVVLVLFSFYFINLKPLLASRNLLKALKDASLDGRNADLVLSDFERVFKLNTFGTPEAREQLGNYANQFAGSDASQEAKVKAIEAGIIALERQIKEYPSDPRGYMFLAALYPRIGRIDEAIKTLEAAHALSPRRPQILFVLAEAHLNKGEPMRAFEVMERAYWLDPTYSQAVRNLAVVAVLNRKVEYAEDLLKKHEGGPVVADQQLINAYAHIGDFARVRDIWLKFIEIDPANAQHHVSLAATYIKLGERSKAIKELEEAVRLKPSFKDEAERLIKKI